MNVALRTFVSLAVLIVTYAIFQTIAFAERGTSQQREACTPDVFRLCSSEIPDPDRIVVCLKRKISQLSDQCRGVLDVREELAKRPVPVGRQGE